MLKTPKNFIPVKKLDFISYQMITLAGFMTVLPIAWLTGNRNPINRKTINHTCLNYLQRLIKPSLDSFRHFG